MQYIDDKKVLGEAIGDLVAPPTSEKALSLLVKWTKYEKTPHPKYDQDIWPVKIDDDLSVVAVTRPDTKGVGLVFRQLVDRIPVLDKDTGEQKVHKDGGPMFQTKYEIVGLRPCIDAHQALEILEQIRSAVESVAARDIDGFGNVDESAAADEAAALSELDEIGI